MLKFSIHRALNDYGWLIAILVACFAFSSVYLKAPSLIGVALPGDTIVAFEPGTGIDVAAYCKAAKTVDVLRVPGAEVLGTMREARNSDLDYIRWQDAADNTAATRFYVDKAGQPQHENVNIVTKDAVACMRNVR